MAARTARTLALLGAVAALSACGGSGGGNPPAGTILTVADYDGTYFIVFKTSGTTGTPEVLATTGTLTTDGAGNAAHSHTINHEGTVSGPSTTDYEYSVAADGALDLRIGTTLFARGGLSSDGRCALLGNMVPGTLPGVLVQLRREGLHGLSSLSGAYHYVELTYSPLGTASITFSGSVTFDGAGAGTASAMANAMGTISGPLGGPISYTVIGDGTSTFTLGSGVLEGGVADGGAVAIWGGATNGPESPGIAVAIKAASAAGLATLQGSYWIVGLARDPVSDDFRSFHGTAVADGIGNVTLLSTSNTEGVIATEPPQPTTYTVAPNGKLTVAAGGDALVGGVSADGRFAVVGGGTTPGSEPTICVLCRK